MTLTLLVSLLTVPSVFDATPLVGSAKGLEEQHEATACEAVGNNWTSCQNAISSGDTYAEANDGGAEGGSPTPLVAYQDTQQSTSSTTLQAAGAETSALSSGVNYLVIYSGNHGGSDNSAVSELVLEFGSTVIARGVGEGRGTDNHWDSGQTSGVYVVTGDGTSTLRFRFRCVTSFDTCYAGAMAIVAVPLNLLTEGEDYWKEVRNGDSFDVTNAPTDNWVNLLTATFDLPEAGDYIVLMSGEGSTSPDEGDEGVRMRFLANGGVMGSEYVQEYEDSRDSYNFMKAQVAGLTSGPKTFEIEVRSREVDSADFRRGRIVVLRASAFDQIIQSTDNTGASTTSNAFVDFSGLDTVYAPHQQEYVVVLASAVLGLSVDDSATAELRDDTAGISYRVDSGEYENDNGLDSNRDQQPTLMVHSEQVDSSATWKLRYRATTSGTAVIGRNAASSSGIRSDLIVWGLSLPGPGKNDTAWYDFGYNLDPGDTVNKVEVGVEWFRVSPDPILNVTLSWDGGSSWAGNQTATTKAVDDDTVEWLNFTSATDWNAAKLSDANLRVRVGANASGARLDYVILRVAYDDAPEASNFRLEDSDGQSRAGDMLDVEVQYFFAFNVTDQEGWLDIGLDGYVSLRLWYDGNIAPELTFDEQLNGSDYRIELRFTDLSDPGNATLDEWGVTEGNVTYNATASSTTALMSGSTLIGYEFILALSLGLDVKAATDPTNDTEGSYNDKDSWNAEVEASDGVGTATLQTAAGGEHLEFGVLSAALMEYSAATSESVIQPGQTTTYRVDLNNSGQRDASTVWVNVTLPTELTYVSDDASSIGGVRSCCYSFEFTGVAPGSLMFNLTASALGGVPNGTLAVTSFSFEASDQLGRPLPPAAQDVQVTIISGDLNVSLLTSALSVDPGDQIANTLTVANEGSGIAQNLLVRTVVDQNTTYVSSSPAGTYNPVTWELSWTASILSPGASSDFDWIVDVKVGIADLSTITSQAQVLYEDYSGTPRPAEYALALSTIRAPFFATDLLIDRTEAERGQEVTVTLYYNNTGSGTALAAWSNWSIEDSYQLISLLPSLPYEVTEEGFSVSLSNVPTGSHSITARLLVVRGMDDGMDMSVRVNWSATDGNGNPLPPGSLLVSVELLAPLTTLSLESSTARAGTESSFFLNVTVRNVGGAPAFGWLNLSLPSGVVYVDDTGSIKPTQTTQGVSWELTSLPGDSLLLSVELQNVEGNGMVSLRFDFNYTDGRGSLPVRAISNAVSLDLVQQGTGLDLPWVWWWVLLPLAAVPLAVIPVLLRRRSGKGRVDEVFVVDKAGILLAHRSSSVLQHKDRDLVVGMLTAIQAYVQDTFREEGGDEIKSIEFGNRKIWIERGLQHYIAVVYRGTAPGKLAKRIKEVSEKIEEKFGWVLVNWSGDMDSIQGIGGLLPKIWKGEER